MKDLFVMDFYAKTYDEKTFSQTVYEHCVCVGEVAEQLCIIRNYKLFDIKYIAFICALHDIGKITPSFQYKLYQSIGQEFQYNKCKIADLYKQYENLIGYHAGASEQYIITHKFLKNKNIEYIINRHHGFTPNIEKPIFLSSSIKDERYDKCLDKDWDKFRDELVQNLMTYFNISESDIIKIENVNIMIISGILSLSDWIASCYLINQKIDNTLKETVNNILKQIGIEMVICKNNLSFKDVFGFTPYKSQENIFNNINDYGLYIVEEQTGKGKTEAALYSAYKLIESGKCSGLYFGLPTQVTSNKIFERVDQFSKKVFNNNFNTKLLHSNSSSFLNSYNDYIDKNDWFDNKNTKLFFPIATGTIDQILMSTLNTKFNFVRSFSLYNKVIIIDEVHSYDEYTGKLINFLIEECQNMNCVIICLSATMSNILKQNLTKYANFSDKYPLLTSITKNNFNEIELNSNNNNSKQYNISINDNDNLCLNNALKEIKNGYNVLWIENSVKRAQEIYSFFLHENVECGLLHSKFILTDRNKNEKEWITKFGKNSNNRKSHGRILIGTQVLEQSIDIDADKLYTRICPIDMLAQRIGRIERFNEKFERFTDIPEIVILSETLNNIQNKNIEDWFIIKDDDEYSGFIYPKHILYRTLEYFTNITNIKYPNDYRKQLDFVFNPENYDFTNNKFSELYKKDIIMKNNKNNRANNNKASFSKTIYNTENITRLIDDKNTKTILIPCIHRGVSGIIHYLSFLREFSLYTQGCFPFQN